MVPIGMGELGSLGVCLRGLIFRAVERTLDREHRSHSQDLFGATQIGGDNEGLGEGGVKGELRHLSAQASQQSVIIKCVVSIEVLQRPYQGLGGRRVHEVEAQQVVDAHGLELQYDRSQVGSLNSLGWLRPSSHSQGAASVYKR